MVKHNWNDEEIKYLRKGIKQTEQVNEWSWWLMFGAIVIMEIILIGKIISLF